MIENDRKILKKTLTKPFLFVIITFVCRGIAQLVEYWSPKPWVVGSSPSAPAKERGIGCVSILFLFLYCGPADLKGSGSE